MNKRQCYGINGCALHFNDYITYMPPEIKVWGLSSVRHLYLYIFIIYCSNYQMKSGGTPSVSSNFGVI